MRRLVFAALLTVQAAACASLAGEERAPPRGAPAAPPVAGNDARLLVDGPRTHRAMFAAMEGARDHVNLETYILEGGLRFWIGEDKAEVVDVMAGDVRHVRRNVQHEAVALEDTLDVDVFSPPREDWINKTDDYLR